LPPEEAAKFYNDWFLGWFHSVSTQLREFYLSLGATGFADIGNTAVEVPGSK
jgi:hypothetical protein